MTTDLLYRLRALFRRRAVEADMEDELRFHFEREVDKRVAAGTTRAEAERLARLAFGGADAIREECRRARGVSLLDTLGRDLLYGLRVLRKSPTFSAVAILTLALGIGANTALYSVVHGVLFKPLPFPHAERLVRLHESKPNFEAGSISWPNFRDWRRQTRSFDALALARRYSFGMTGRGDAEEVKGNFVSADFFSVFGVKPLLGRDFLPGEDEVGAPPAVIVSAAFWQRKLGGMPDVLHGSLVLEGRAYPIVGVIPASFSLRTDSFSAADVYVPVGQWSNPLLARRGSSNGMHGFGRLAPGVSLEQARADLAVITHGLAAAFPDADTGIGAQVVPLKEHMVGAARPYLLVLLGAVGCVLLIACINVANLLLARSTGRAGEFAVRAALGASRGRVIRQLLTESLLLATAGGGLGLLLAALGTRAMVAAAAALTDSLPRADEIRLDGPVLLFTFAVSLAAGTLFGLLPALKASRPAAHPTLKEGGRGASGVRHRAQGVFIVVETAMALVLLIGAGLLIRSLAAVWQVSPGFAPDHVMTFRLSLPPSSFKASPAAVRAAFHQVDAQIAAIPGVETVSMSWGALPMIDDDEIRFWRDDRPRPVNDHELSWALHYAIEPQYFAALRIQPLRGRLLNAHDDEHAPAVAVIDDVFARQYFPGDEPLHKILDRQDAGKVEIVGIVRHVRQWGLDVDDTTPLRAQIYLPFMQLPDDSLGLAARGADVVVRAAGGPGAAAAPADGLAARSAPPGHSASRGPAGPPAAAGSAVVAATGRPDLLAAIRARLRAASAEHVLYSAQTMDDTIASSLGARRFAMILFGVFAALALALAAVGIYGVTAYLVGRKTHEIGVRMALGARRRDVLRLVLGDGARWAALGMALGLAASLALTRVMTGLLFGVRPTDPATFALVALVLGLVTLVACYVPARRGMAVDPAEALRAE